LPNSQFQIWILLLVIALAMVALFGWERIQVEVESSWLIIKSTVWGLYAWFLDKIAIRTIRTYGQTRIDILTKSYELRNRIAKQNIETSRRRAEYNRVSAEYWRTKARTTRRIRLLRSRLTGEITEDEYRNALAQDKRDIELAKKQKQLARQWAAGKIAETDYRQQLDAISSGESPDSQAS